MAPRVKRLAGQGAQNIGAFTADKVKAANTPFQNLKLPDLNDSTTPNMLMQAGKFTQEAAGTIAQISQGIRQDQADAFLLNVGNAASSKGQDLTAQYKSAPTNYNPVTGETSQNPDAAYGSKANPKWFSDTMGKWDAHEKSVRGTDEYKDLNTANKLAVDAKLAASKNGFRATALSWMVDQGKVARSSALDNTIEQKTNDLITNPDQARSHSVGLVTAIENKFSNTGATNGEIETAARTAVGGAIATAVDNILKSDDSDKVKKAQAVLDSAKTFKVRGKEITIKGDALNDVQQSITNEIGSQRNAGEAAALAKDYKPEDAAAAQLKVDKMDLPQVDKDDIMTRYKARIGITVAAQRQKLYNIKKEQSKKAANGLPLDQSQLGQLDGPTQIALESMRADAEQKKVNPDYDRPTKYEKVDNNGKLVGGLDHWLAQSTSKRADFTEEMLVATYKKDLSGKDWSSVVNDWRLARESKNKTASNLFTSNIKAQTALAKEQASFFAGLVNKAPVVGGLTGTGTKDTIAAENIKTELLKEFREINDGRKITTTEMSKLISAGTLRIALDSGKIRGTQLRQSGLVLKAKDRSAAFDSIPPKDRVDYLGLYMRQNIVDESKGIEMADFNVWLTTFNASTLNPYNETSNPNGLSATRRNQIVSAINKANQRNNITTPPTQIEIMNLHRLELVRNR